MRAYIFTDAALKKHAGQFAWLSINTEQSKNASFTEKYPITGWPTYLVIDPKTEKPVLRWYGSTTAAQMEKLLEDGAAAVRDTAKDPVLASLAHADRLYAERKGPDAARAYQETLNLAPADWPARPRVVEKLTLALLTSHDYENCARVAREEGGQLPRGTSFANAIATGLDCAGSARSGAWIAGAQTALKSLGEEAVHLPGLLGDDRANLFSLLVDTEVAQKDEAGAKKLMGEWLAFLDQEERRAPNAEARASLDTWRVTAAMRIGDPSRALPALQASERDLPDDYNPPQRQASVYSAMGRFDDALAASDRALAKAYGPRRVLVFMTRASIYQKKGDAAAARRTVEEAVKFAESLPRSQYSEQQLASLKKQIERFQ